LWRAGLRTARRQEARHGLNTFVAELGECLGQELTHQDVLSYVLAFLNSSAAAFLLRIGREPTPMGSWNINEEYLSLIRLPIPDRGTAAQILERSRECVNLTRAGDSTSQSDAELDRLVFVAYGLAGTEDERTITSWAAEARSTEE
jgi:hypothetical protein